MIPKELPIESGMYVRHDEGGLLYQIKGTALRTDDYEQTHVLGAMSVNYIQREDGSYPAGTEYNKSEDDFRNNFTAVPSDTTNSN